MNFFSFCISDFGQIGVLFWVFLLKKRGFILGFSISCLGSGDEEEGGQSPLPLCKAGLTLGFPICLGCSGEERSGGPPTFLLHW